MYDNVIQCLGSVGWQESVNVISAELAAVPDLSGCLEERK